MADRSERKPQVVTISLPKGEEEVGRFLERAQQGDESTLPVVHEWLRRSPDLAEEIGNIAARAEEAWLKMVAGENLLFREALGRKLAALKSELSGPQPSPLERLLVDRIAACWLQVHCVDAATAQNAGQISREWADYHGKRQERAQRRFLGAIKALAQVRRLLWPMIQVNIAERQVNVAAPVSSPGLVASK